MGIGDDVAPFGSAFGPEAKPPMKSPGKPVAHQMLKNSEPPQYNKQKVLPFNC